MLNILPLDIDKSIDIWHGGEDRIISIAMVEEFTQKSELLSLHHLKDEGHYSIAIEHIDWILNTHKRVL